MRLQKTMKIDPVRPFKVAY